MNANGKVGESRIGFAITKRVEEAVDENRERITKREERELKDQFVNSEERENLTERIIG